MHTSGLIFRTAGPWGPGKGSNLTPTEVDENFDDLDERVDTLETSPPTPVEISSITVTGASMTVNMSDGSSFGPFTLPTATFDFRGDWAPLTQYFINDVFFVSDSGVYLVTTDFESATAFDPLATEITKMFPDVAIDTLDDVSDVDYDTAGPAEGEVLVRRSGAWVHEPGVGRQTIWIPAAEMQPTVTAGAGDHNTDTGLATVELTAGRPNVTHLPFDHLSEQNAQWSIAMPKSWDLGDLLFQVIYSHGGGQTGGLDGVAWGLSALAVGDGESIDAVFGAEVTVTKDASAADTEHKTGISAAITPAGTIAAGDTLYFNLARKVGDAADDLDLEARLQGIKLFYDTTALTDD